MGCPGNVVVKQLKASPAWEGIGELEKRLLNEFQQNLPLTSEPFGDIADRLEVEEETVIDALRRLREEGLISRVGPVFRPHSVGVSTLAAMEVAPARLEEVASLLNGYSEVNHNYEREHRINLWFVVTAPDQDHLERVLGDMEKRTGLEVLSLPLLESYHLNLGFRLPWSRSKGRAQARSTVDQERTRFTHTDIYPPSGSGGRRMISDETELRLVAAIQRGFPLTKRPFVAIAREIGIREKEVMELLRSWLKERIINRIGVVVRHHELGYRSNAMVVWEVPDDDVSRLGAVMGDFNFVTLCYRRAKSLPRWPYNLFCMIHGQDRDTVQGNIAQLIHQSGSEQIPHEVLFSRKRFKQRGAHYQSPAAGTSASTGQSSADLQLMARKN